VMGECDCETIGSPSRLRLIRKDEVLTKVQSTLGLRCEENTVCQKWNSPRSRYES
jgi:hypothetical protein